MKIELKKISFSERMSEETNCFAADLFINGKKVGYVKNDGRGGCTDYHANTSCASGFTRVNIELIAEAEKYCKTLPHNEFGEQTLEDVINDCLEAYLKDKAEKKIEKKMQKEYLTAICYGARIKGGYSYASAFWKDYNKKYVPLAKVPLAALQKRYDDIKLRLNDNDVVLNTNLTALGIQI